MSARRDCRAFLYAKNAPAFTGACLERVAGIEPVTKAWEAFILPLNYTRVSINRIACFSPFVKSGFSGLQQNPQGKISMSRTVF